MTQIELRIKELLVELQARTDQMSVKVAKVDGLEKRIAELEAALEHASRRLCHNIDCDCEPDRMMYRRTLSATGQQEHPDTVTVKHCCGESGFGREWPGEPRDVCQVCAKRAEQWEREALEKPLEEETPQLVEFAVGVDEEADRG